MGHLLPVGEGKAKENKIPNDLDSKDMLMKVKGEKSLIVGLDIGTSKVVAIVGEYVPANRSR